jgi:hypothetical protein
MDDTQQIEIEYDVSKEVGRAAYQYLYNSKVNPKNFIWVGVVLLLYYLYSFYTDGFNKQDLWFYLPLLGFPLGILITRYYLPLIWGNRMYKQHLGKKIKWVITKQNIQLSIGKAGKTVPWSYFQKAILSNGIILMVTATGIITPIPINAFKEGEFEVFKAWIEENLPG